MPSYETAYVGSSPAEEDCAQVGRTPDYEKHNRLEVEIYRAAIIARFGIPPEGVVLEAKSCPHDFGSSYELQARYDVENEAAVAYAEAVEQGLARWLDTGFLAPFEYGPNAAVRTTNYRTRNEAVQRVIVTLERQRLSGYGTPAEAVFLSNLRAAFPAPAEQADAILRQISTERQIRRPEHHSVDLYFPYKLTFFPELFNQHRGPDYPQGDVIDVTAHELRLQRSTYIVCDIGSVPTLDQALALCWEHMARYVIR